MLAALLEETPPLRWLRARWQVFKAKLPLFCARSLQTLHQLGRVWQAALEVQADTMTFSNSCTHRRNCQLRTRGQIKVLLCHALPSGSKKNVILSKKSVSEQNLRLWMWRCIDRHIYGNAMYKLQKGKKEMQPHFPFREETQKSLEIMLPVILMHGWTDPFSFSLPWLPHTRDKIGSYLLYDAGRWVRYGSSRVLKGFLCWGCHCSSAFKDGFKLNW